MNYQTPQNRPPGFHWREGISRQLSAEPRISCSAHHRRSHTASRRLVASLGFREVGIYEKHGQLDGVWRDVAIVEKLI